MAFYDSFSWNWSAKCHSEWWMCELCWHIIKNRICRGYWAKVRNCLTDVSFCSFVIVTKLTRSSAVALIAYVVVGSAKNSLLLDFCFYRYLLWLWHLDPWIKMLIQALLWQQSQVQNRAFVKLLANYQIGFDYKFRPMISLHEESDCVPAVHLRTYLKLT